MLLGSAQGGGGELKDAVHWVNLKWGSDISRLCCGLIFSWRATMKNSTVSRKEHTGVSSAALTSQISVVTSQIREANVAKTQGRLSQGMFYHLIFSLNIIHNISLPTFKIATSKMTEDNTTAMLTDNITRWMTRSKYKVIYLLFELEIWKHVWEIQWFILLYE